MMETLLKGQEAFREFQKGKDAWNRVIEDKGVTKVDFEGVAFATALDSETLDFRGFEFPYVTFYSCNFEQLTKIDFSEAAFRGDAHFSRVEFPKAKLLFTGAKFWTVARFSGAKYSGDVDFSGTSITVGDFSDTKWSQAAKISFKDACVFDVLNFSSLRSNGFLKFELSFKRFVPIVVFSHSEFQRIGITSESTYGIGHLFLNGLKIRDICYVNGIIAERIEMSNCDFDEICTLNNIKAQRLNCAGSIFKRNAVFQDIDVRRYIDLSGCSFLHPVAIDGIHVGDPVGRRFFGSIIGVGSYDKDQVDFDKEAEAHANISHREVSQYMRSYRRLKQLAADSENHSLELDMFALELKAIRWLKERWWERIPYDLYALFSDYGRSLLRPFVGLFTFWILFSLVYMGCAASSSRSDFLGQWSAGLLLSLAQSVPFLTWHRTAKSEALGVLYPAAGGFDVPWLVHLAAVSQSILAVIFIFLLGLGIRNRFRI